MSQREISYQTAAELDIKHEGDGFIIIEVDEIVGMKDNTVKVRQVLGHIDNCFTIISYGTFAFEIIKRIIR
jgi:hypothetical protein